MPAASGCRAASSYPRGMSCLSVDPSGPALKRVRAAALYAAALTLTQALRLGDAAVVMPMDFFKLIWAAAFGVLIFGEFPTLYTWIGGFMIFASATYIALRERALARTRAAANKDV